MEDLMMKFLKNLGKFKKLKGKSFKKKLKYNSR